MKRWMPILMSVSVAVLLSACGSSSGDPADAGGDAAGVKDERPTGDKGDPGSDPAGADTLTTVDQVKAALAADHTSADWYPYLADITLETYLGAPVLLLHVTWDDNDTDYEGKSDRSFAMLLALQDYDTPLTANVSTLDGSGNLFGAGSTSQAGAMPMADRFELPPAPTTTAEMQAWLDAVYGPGGLVKLGPEETWYAAITSIGPGPDAPLTVTTTPAPEDKLGMTLLQMALQTSGSALMESFALNHAAGYGPVGFAPPGEPGAFGYYYFP